MPRPVAEAAEAAVGILLDACAEDHTLRAAPDLRTAAVRLVLRTLLARDIDVLPEYDDLDTAATRLLRRRPIAPDAHAAADALLIAADPLPLDALGALSQRLRSGGDAPDHRRAIGAYYTPPEVIEVLLERGLDPLLGAAPAAISICDPACGVGDVLVAAAERLAGQDPQGFMPRGGLYGVDVDPLAVELCRLRLWSAGERDERARVRWGNALIGRSFGAAGDRVRGLPNALDWPSAFPGIAARGGFDLVIGNPPWIAHAGRAAQPLPAELKAHFAATDPAFRGYRTTHGMFAHRGALLVRPGGRLAFVLPTSVADLDGYAPARRAHDALARPDTPLRDFGDGAFAGVFQPCMVLVSERRAEAVAELPPTTWELERDDLSAAAAALLVRLAALATLPAALFGERGVQTTDAATALRAAPAPDGRFTVALRAGADVTAHDLHAPSCHGDPALLPAHVADAARWSAVAFLVRQTARLPIAALNDGRAFRNSLLAGFELPEWPARGVVALLNSSLIAFHHHARFRDARQGMPQVKVSHLRAIPAPCDPRLVEALDALAGTWSAAPGPDDLRDVDELVFDAYELDAAERGAVRARVAKLLAPARSR